MKNTMSNSTFCGFLVVGRSSYIAFEACAFQEDCSYTVTIEADGACFKYDESTLSVMSKANTMEEFCLWERLTLKKLFNPYSHGPSIHYVIT